jgi:hypothetical protein
VTLGEFAASLLFGLLSVVLPLVIFISAVALCVFLARWWLARKS